ncbi:MAG: hypothetical protein ACRYF2_23610 [Janthinobacterium lividum]
MADIRMSLADAAMALGIAPNSVRSRFKAGKLRGERDNLGKIWVWLDDADSSIVGSKFKPSKPSIEGFEQGRFEALEAHLRTLTEQLAFTQSELVTLRPRASAADRLEAEVAGLEVLRDEVRADRDHWRGVAEQALADRQQEPELRRGLWARLFGRLQEG